MTESDYKYLQERLSKKSENNPYKFTGYCRRKEYFIRVLSQEG